MEFSGLYTEGNSSSKMFGWNQLSYLTMMPTRSFFKDNERWRNSYQINETYEFIKEIKIFLRGGLRYFNVYILLIEWRLWCCTRGNFEKS